MCVSRSHLANALLAQVLPAVPRKGLVPSVPASLARVEAERASTRNFHSCPRDLKPNTQPSFHCRIQKWETVLSYWQSQPLSSEGRGSRSRSQSHSSLQSGPSSVRWIEASRSHCSFSFCDRTEPPKRRCEQLEGLKHQLQLKKLP